MSEEVKEILDDLRNINNYDYSEICDNENNIIEKEYDIYLSKNKIDLLLDYITNLQEENEFLKLNNPEMNIEHFRIVKENKRKIDNLRKENEKYKKIFEGKERFSKIMPEDIDFIILSKSDYDRQEKDIQLELIDYKSRCEKAIELIKEAGCYDEKTKTFCDDIWEELSKLLNILNGGDEE